MSTQLAPVVSGGGGGTPASTVVSETAFGQASAVGTSTDYARADHTHGTPAAPAVAGGWTDTGTLVALTTSTDVVTIGAVAAATNRKLTIENTGTDLGVRVTTINSTDPVLDTYSLNGAGPDDAFARFLIDGAGNHTWSSGSAAADLRIRRSGVNTLTFDNGSTNGATLVPATDASGVFGSASLRWGDVVANTHRVFPSAGAANASASLTSGALKLGPGAGTALDTQIIRNATKTLQVDDNAGGAATFKVIGTTQSQARAIAVTAVKVAAYVVGVADDVVLVDPTAGAFDVTLPNANVLAGRRIQVKRTTTSANAVTVKSGGGTIDNIAAATGFSLAGGTLASISVVSDGTNWWII